MSFPGLWSSEDHLLNPKGTAIFEWMIVTVPLPSSHLPLNGKNEWPGNGALRMILCKGNGSLLF